MTFDEIVAQVMDRLNLTSLDARNRVEIAVNDIYKQVVSGIGLVTSERREQPITVDPTDTDSILPDLRIDDMEKVLSVKYPVPTSNRLRILDELTFNEINGMSVLTDRIPRAWALVRMGAGEVTIRLDSYTATDSFDLVIEGYDRTDELQGDVEPFMPTNFHDVIVEGTIARELRKMEKKELASIAAAEFERRLSDLKFFIAKSIGLDLYQGKDRPGLWWHRAWWNRGYWIN